MYVLRRNADAVYLAVYLINDKGDHKILENWAAKKSRKITIIIYLGSICFDEGTIKETIVSKTTSKEKNILADEKSRSSVSLDKKETGSVQWSEHEFRLNLQYLLREWRGAPLKARNSCWYNAHSAEWYYIIFMWIIFRIVITLAKIWPINSKWSIVFGLLIIIPFISFSQRPFGYHLDGWRFCI